ncbi:MYB DNA-binding domain protein [Moelleriella libera RCEF 2490]|uniref:MYB DNA-binding domain protein n=1 Tax=Moelleriella libera RCEF 2490 TaxID=1081109 RepID=A0A168BLF3_9HYPO|nr:MYB DNA-binding domain protein [Moelleriella libera RCEF 2490]
MQSWQLGPVPPEFVFPNSTHPPPNDMQNHNYQNGRPDQRMEFPYGHPGAGMAAQQQQQQQPSPSQQQQHQPNPGQANVIIPQPAVTPNQHQQQQQQQQQQSQPSTPAPQQQNRSRKRPAPTTAPAPVNAAAAAVAAAAAAVANGPPPPVAPGQLPSSMPPNSAPQAPPPVPQAHKEEANSTPVQPPPAKKGRTNTPWTPQEEQRLKQMRDASNTWAEIAKTFPTRTEGSVKKHWYKDMHYAEFAEDESQALLNAIKEYENNKWKVIGQKVGKPAKACEQYAKEHFPDIFASGKGR